MPDETVQINLAQPARNGQQLAGPAPAADAYTGLNSSPDGLSPDEAQRRLAEYGYNEIAENKTNPILALLAYFWGPIPWMIEVAAVLSALVRHWADFAIILVLLLVK